MKHDKDTRRADNGADAGATKRSDTKGNGKRKKALAPDPLSNKEYASALKDLHIELVRLQEWVKHARAQGLRCLRRSRWSGKGGTIKAITERVSPRVFRVVALPAPTEREKSQMYLQRYIASPAAGEIVIFDRSWYNRAGVERVLGFCSEEQAKATSGSAGREGDR